MKSAAGWLLLLYALPLCALIQPLPLPEGALADQEKAASRHVEDFLADCFHHPQLQRPADITVKGMPLTRVIEMLADQAGFSVVVDDEVKGMVPLLMARGEPVGSVLHALLAGHSPPLGILISNSMLHVASRTTLLKQARSYLRAAPGPLERASLPLSWAQWGEPLKLRLEAMWHHCLRQHVGFPRAQFFFTDDEARSVFVQGTAPQVALFRQMVAALEVPRPQVEIAARVVIARADFVTKLGLNAQLLYRGGKLPFASIGGAASATLPSLLKTTAPVGQGLELPLLFSGPGSMNVLNIVLNAAENRNLVKTLLAPHITSCSGRQALLHEGYSVPIESLTEDAVEGRTRTVRSAQYKDVGVKVQIKPFVLPDSKRVKIEVLVENSHLSAATTTSAYPSITTSKIHNTVVLDDGQTILLGGLTQTGASKEKTGVPFLSRLPLIGWLFRGRVQSKEERRLYVFLHARLVYFS